MKMKLKFQLKLKFQAFNLPHRKRHWVMFFGDVKNESDEINLIEPDREMW